MKLEGVMPALITPADSNGNLNVKELEKLLERHISEGAAGFYIGGATGEGVTISMQLHKDMTRESIRIVNKRVPCIVHVARINFDEMIELAKYAEAQGADYLSAIPPIYYRYSENEIYAYFKKLCDSVNIPVLIYNNPLTGVSFSDGLLDKLFAIDNLVGIKWTNPNYLSVIGMKSKNPDLIIVNGPDELLMLGLMAGCDGGIGTTYNFMLPTFVKIYNAMKSGNIDEARKYQTLATNIIFAILPYGALKATKFLLSKQGHDVYHNFYPNAYYTKEEEEAILKGVRAAGLEI